MSVSSPTFLPLDDVVYGEAVQVAPDVRRVIAENPSKFTYRGTGTYIIGSGDVVVIDPGPRLDSHRDALAAALKGERVRAILITHCHADHSPLSEWLKAETGAPTFAVGPHETVDEPEGMFEGEEELAQIVDLMVVLVCQIKPVGLHGVVLHGRRDFPFLGFCPFGEGGFFGFARAFGPEPDLACALDAHAQFDGTNWARSSPVVAQGKLKQRCGTGDAGVERGAADGRFLKVGDRPETECGRGIGAIPGLHRVRLPFRAVPAGGREFKFIQ